MPLLTELGNLILFGCYKDAAPTALNMAAWILVGLAPHHHDINPADNVLGQHRHAIKTPGNDFISMYHVPCPVPEMAVGRWEMKVGGKVNGQVSRHPPSPNSHLLALRLGGLALNLVALALNYPLAKDLRLTHFRAMESHELLREVFDRKGTKKVSADLKLSTSMIYKWAQPPKQIGGIENPLDRVDALIQSTGDGRIAQWVCQRAGGFFIANPKRAPHPHQLIPATNQIVQEFADLLHTIALATADEKITTAEAKQIRARWEELKSVTEGFVAAAESGDFAALKGNPTPGRKEAKPQD